MMCDSAEEFVSASTIMLPDDQSFRMIQLGQRTVILSVSEAGVQIGQGTDIGPQVTDSVNGYYIFAEKVTVVDSFSVTLSKDSDDSKSSDPIASICTGDLSLESSGLVTLDVSGAAGTDNDTGAQREPDIDGKPAGSLCVYIENNTSDAVHNLVLKARGGDGGDTREKQGTAGHGGNGGQVQYIAYSYLTDVYLKLDFFARNMSWNRDLPGDTPLTLDHPIVVYLQQALDLADALPQSNSISEDIQSTVDMFQPIANICASAQTLRPPTIDNARDAVWEVRQAVRAQLDSDDLAITIYVEGGQGGSPEPVLSGGERGKPGKPGQRGKILSADFLYRIDADLLRTQTMVFVHPEHCEMLYERAMTYWYFGRTSTAMDLLSRLLFRTSFLPLKSTDALYQAYEKQEKVLGCTNSVAGLVDVRRRAMQQYSILLTGQVDFYGHSVFWVPRVSYSEYNKYIDGAMDVYIHLEQSYINYCAALDQQQQTNDAIQQSAAKIDGTLATMQTERVTLVSSLQDLESKIKAADPVVEQKHRDFAAAYQEFEDIFNKPPPHGISPRQLFNAAITVASSASKVVGAAKAIDQLWSDFNGDPDHIGTDSGVPVNKKYLMGQIKRSIVTGLDDFTSELTTAELNGEFQVDGRLPKFVMEEGQLNEILSQYSNAAFAEAGQELVDAYDDFIKALSSRNDDIVAYNAVIRLIVAQSQEMAKLKAMKELAGKHTLTDADLKQMTGYVRMLFENARARVMRYLSMGQRALTFKILQSKDLLSMEISGSGSADVPLSVTSDVLMTIRSNLQDLLLTATEDNSGIPATFPADWASGTGKRRWLSATELQTFLTERIVMLPITPVFPKQKSSSLSSDFDSSANVRVYRVRFYLQGLKATSDCPSMPKMKSIIAHSGREVIVSRRGVSNLFDHSPLNTLHSYELDGNGRVVNVVDNGDLVEFVPGSAFGAPGPFTMWGVDSSSAEWEMLDTSEVVGAYLEFFGTNYAFFK